MRNLANFAVFQVVWFACVLGAARGNGWIGPLATLAALGYHLATDEDRRGQLRLIAVVFLIGAVVDSALQAVGAMTYALPLAAIAPVEPPWVLSLWVAFGMLLDRSLAWLQGKPLLAAAFGLVGGPLSMRAGVALGGVAWGDDVRLSVVLIGLEWAVLTPLFLALATRFARRPENFPAGSPTEERVG